MGDLDCGDCYCGDFECGDCDCGDCDCGDCNCCDCDKCCRCGDCCQCCSCSQATNSWLYTNYICAGCFTCTDTSLDLAEHAESAQKEKKQNESERKDVYLAGGEGESEFPPLPVMTQPGPTAIPEQVQPGSHTPDVVTPPSHHHHTETGI